MKFRKGDEVFNLTTKERSVVLEDQGSDDLVKVRDEDNNEIELSKEWLIPRRKKSYSLEDLTHV